MYSIPLFFPALIEVSAKLVKYDSPLVRECCRFDMVKLISEKQVAVCSNLNFDFVKIIRSFLGNIFLHYSRSQQSCCMHIIAFFQH